MLTDEDYTDLWNAPTPAGFGRGATPPPAYNDYVIRENQLEDYLDIFRGHDTRAGRPIPVGGWYYDHPFFPPPGVAGFVPPPVAHNPTIRYILIAEAANPTAPTYFYNVLHLGNSRYYSAPRDAFGIPDGPKPGVLWQLAQQGVLLLDLYPFAINYRDIRENLIFAGVSTHFWGIPAPALAPETIGSRIHALAGLLDPQGFKLAFVAPPKLSHFLAEQINAGALADFGATIRMGVNAMVPPVLPALGGFIPGAPPTAHLVGLGGFMRPLVNVTSVPIYACACYDGSNSPNRLFIQNALLP